MTSPLIRVIIVEDQPHIRKDVELLMADRPDFVVVGTCGTVKEAKQLIQNKNPDLLLLDIHLPDGTGFDVLKNNCQEFKIIFLTAYEQHAIQAIKYGALDYMVKPVDEREFTEALQKVIQFKPVGKEQISIAEKYHQEGNKRRMVLRSQDHLQIVDTADIVYCHSDAGYTTFYLSDGRKILTSRILKEYEDILLEPVFIRPHQSFLVNSRYIDKYKKDGGLTLKNGAEIPVATRRKEAIVNFFNRL